MDGRKGVSLRICKVPDDSARREQSATLSFCGESGIVTLTAEDVIRLIMRQPLMRTSVSLSTIVIALLGQRIRTKDLDTIDLEEYIPTTIAESGEKLHNNPERI